MVGEFEKRIDEIVEYLEHNGYNAGFMVSESKIESFWNVFEVARREFLEINTPYPDVFAATVLDWFSKWFGGGEE